MNKRSTQAALKILLLLEEYSQSELEEALKLIYNNEPRAKEKRQPTSNTVKVSKPRGGTQKSIALFALESADPQKYEILRNLDQGLREGILFPGASQLKRFVEYVDKDTAKAKSRQSMISHFITYLSKLEMSHIKTIINNLPRKQDTQNEYSQLANFIISGEKNSPEK